LQQAQERVREQQERLEQPQNKKKAKIWEL